MRFLKQKIIYHIVAAHGCFQCEIEPGHFSHTGSSCKMLFPHTLPGFISAIHTGYQRPSKQKTRFILCQQKVIGLEFGTMETESLRLEKTLRSLSPTVKPTLPNPALKNSCWFQLQVCCSSPKPHVWFSNIAEESLFCWDSFLIRYVNPTWTISIHQ